MITVRTEPCHRVWLSAGCQSGARWPSLFCAAHFADDLHGLPIAFPNGKPVSPKSWGTQSPFFPPPGLSQSMLKLSPACPHGLPVRQPVPLNLNTSWTRPDLDTAACLVGFTWHFLRMSMTGRHCFRSEFRERATINRKQEHGATLTTNTTGNSVLFLGGDDARIVPDVPGRMWPSGPSADR